MNAKPQSSKKINLLITNDFPPIVSGISTVFYQIWKRLPPDRTMILAPKAPGCDEFDKKEPFHIIRKRIPTGESGKTKLVKMIFNIFYALYHIRKYNIGKLHCGQILSVGPAGLICKKLFGIKYNVYVYGSETLRFGNSRMMSWLMKKVIEEAEDLVPNSAFTMHEYERWGISRKKMVMIVPGVDSVFFHPQEKSRYLVDKYHLQDKQIIMTVGRLDERKGHDMVIRAMAHVVKQFPNVVYMIVGKGREEQRLKNLADNLKLQDHVIFTGFVADESLPDYYNLCDVFVLPNRETELHDQLKGDYEGFGVVFLEASACGKPVIAGKSGGSCEAVVNGVTGLMVDPRNEGEIGRAIERTLSDKNFANQLGMAGRSRAEKEFDWQHIAKTMESIL
ncbi:MAG: glycosyltransferase family 4 protein [Planctomycetes bacterium]|uniref:glycosyltransferase family 4 protein n=1 Tax=Candidatus Wunengus sp. YC65 TaxID=3367701 RepID=UPI001DA2D9D1|nr:glycosyltransferase family 4 protein [Planctomycetota bacterium]